LILPAAINPDAANAVWIERGESIERLSSRLPLESEVEQITEKLVAEAEMFLSA
jgi:hypothetical protein